MRRSSALGLLIFLRVPCRDTEKVLIVPHRVVHASVEPGALPPPPRATDDKESGVDEVPHAGTRLPGVQAREVSNLRLE